MNKNLDISLLEDCKRGDRQALDSLVRRYERQVFNVAFRMLGNPDLAADVTQTTFLKAFEHLNSFNQDKKFFSWIYRIAINESINQIKRRSQLQPLGETQLEQTRDTSTRSPDELVESRRICDEVQAVLLELHEDHRAVIMLRHFLECNYRQIGEILQTPEKTVKSRLFSARRRMRDLMQQRARLLHD